MVRFVAVLSLFAWVGMAQAQISDAPLPKAQVPLAPKVELDMQALLSDPRVTATSLNDPLWTLEPQPGRRLIQIPMIVTPLVGKSSRLTSPPIQMRGGRFIAWQIPRPTPADSHADTAANRAPRLARKLTVTPEGRVQWKLDRNIPGGTLTKTQSIYQLKIDGQALHDLQPERPKITKNAGEDGRAFRARKFEAQRTFREALAAFRQLNDQVKNAPETFDEPLPTRFWAVVEVPDLSRAYEFVGPSPLPWKIDVRAFDTLRRLVQNPVTRLPLDAGVYDDLATLTDATRSNHPYTLRGVAHALAAGKLLAYAQPNGAIYRLAQRLLASDDSPTQRILIGALVVTIPPTMATAQLLKEAATRMTPQEQLASLRGLFSGKHADADHLVEVANTALVDAQGPAPGAVLAELTLAVSPQGQSLDVDTMRTLVSGLALDRLSGDRLDAAIVYCATAAADAQALASAWLNHRLLGSSDLAVVERTLVLLNQVRSDSVFFGPLLIKLFGPPAQDPPAHLLTLSGLIPIDTPGHGLYRCLSAGDAQTRELAWSALPHFAIAQGSAQDMDTRYAQILDAALAQKPTPGGLVLFLADQPDLLRSTQALTDVVVHADAAAAQSAAHALLGSGRPLGQVMVTLDPPRRAQLAQAFYVRPGSRELPPLVTGLLRQPDAIALVKWFGQQVAGGTVPAPALWARQFSKEADLLALAASNDAHVAQGAIAALVVAAGGDRRRSQSVAAQFQQQPVRSADKFRELWTKIKGELYTDQLVAVVGPYRISVVLRPEAATGQVPGDAGGEVQPIVLGVMDLVADAGSIRFATDAVTLSVPTDRLAIRIAKVGQLKNLENEQLVDLPLDTVAGPLDLLPQADGSWVGSVAFGAPPKRILELHLDPLK